MSAIIDVEGIGDIYAETLKEAGIVTTGALLKEGATPAGHKKIEKATGIGHKLILKWTNHVISIASKAYRNSTPSSWKPLVSTQ